MNKKILVLLFAGLVCVSVLHSEERVILSDEGAPSVTIQTFYTLKNLWTDFASLHYANADADETSFALGEYQNKLFECLNIFLQDYSDGDTDKIRDEAISADLYPFILSEAYFYRYIANTKPEFNIIAQPELDEAVKNVIEIVPLDNGQTPMDYEFLPSKTVDTVNSLFSHFNIISNVESAVTSEEKNLVFPSDYQQQVLLLHAFSALEIFINEEDLSIEKIVQLLNNPLAVFMIFLNSDYEYLRQDVLSVITTYEEIFGNPITDDISEDAVAAYDCYNLFTATELSAQTYGIPIESIILHRYASQYAYFRTAPLMVAAFTKTELDGLNLNLAYLSLAGELYVSRINSLAVKALQPVNTSAEENNLDEITSTAANEGADSE